MAQITATLTIRVPSDTYDGLRWLAECRGTSLNAVGVAALTRYLREEEPTVMNNEIVKPKHYGMLSDAARDALHHDIEREELERRIRVGIRVSYSSVHGAPGEPGTVVGYSNGLARVLFNGAPEWMDARLLVVEA